MPAAPGRFPALAAVSRETRSWAGSVRDEVAGSVRDEVEGKREGRGGKGA